MLAYQASNQAMALAAAGLVVPTVDPPLMQTANSDDVCIVPDVMFSYQNQYGTTVKQKAMPNFPVEYLLVSVRGRRRS